jgi:hypothetical protein
MGTIFTMVGGAVLFMAVGVRMGWVR